ncbi:MAG: hypothetical protein RMJ98_02065 [Myxococcales bacterium]|nr:hypothetical protein [Myxococcales bacterium]
MRTFLVLFFPLLTVMCAAFLGCGDEDHTTTDVNQAAGGRSGSASGSSGTSGQSGSAGASGEGGAIQGGSGGAEAGSGGVVAAGAAGSVGGPEGAGGGAGSGGSDAGASGSDPGQGGSDGGTGGTDAGGGGSTEAGAGGSGGVHDGPSVAWKDKPTEPYFIKWQIALDWVFFYEIQLQGKPEEDFQLEVERCQKPAGQPESCSLGGKQPAKEGSGAIKYGVDPSQYAVGENTYRLVLRLYEQDDLVSMDALKIVVIAEP